MAAMQKIIALIIAFINTFMLSTGIRKVPVNEITKEGEQVELISTADSELCATAEYAKNIKNTVQCVYTDPARSAYRMTNGDMKLTHDLKGAGKTAALTDKNGKVFIENSFRSFTTDKAGITGYFENSAAPGRVNTIRLGEYYYECHVRDLETARFKVDKAFHVYGDRIYMQYTAFAKKPTDQLKNFGSEIRIPAATVEKMVIKDKNGTKASPDGIDAASVEYVAFDIKDTGTVGFIIPADGSTEKVKVIKTPAEYILTQYAAFDRSAGINDNTGAGGYGLDSVTFGCRIYTDDTHGFIGVSNASAEERDPVKVKVSEGSSGAYYAGYDALRGAYTLVMNGTDFQTAYDHPDMQFTAPISIEGGKQDRVIYFRANGTNGCLEAAALLDGNKLPVPVDVQVCKNFCGDGGEPFYSVKDIAYGDAIFPVCVGKEQNLSLTLVDLYQNWGKFPIKQLSSIEFHTSYYHLSTGTTESNCIAPYFVFEKDGWTLPDFRTRSGNVWAGQPQYNSVGILKFMQHRDPFSEDGIYGEFAGSDIASDGLTYSDVTNTYIDDTGDFHYTVRHVEMPQTDENRTYYTLKVTFDRKTTYTDFVNDFDLFYFEGRFVKFNKAHYLNKNNVAVAAAVDTGEANKYYVLGDEHPFLGFYNVTADKDEEIDKGLGCNFALIIRDSKITMRGGEKKIPFVFREDSFEHISRGALTLDAGNITFAKGDTIEINMILLPWGTGRETEGSTVLKVREDSAAKPLTVTAEKGEVVEDAFVPTVKADGNDAVFTVKGGRNNCAVLVTGFSSMKNPVIRQLVDGEWQDYDYASSNGYDGYDVKVADDGSYAFSFVYEAEDPDTEYTFRVYAAR